VVVVCAGGAGGAAAVLPARGAAMLDVRVAYRAV
jgi:hypothetical protein